MTQNILPKEKRQDLKQGYRMRKAIVFSWAFLFLGILAMVVFIPNFSLVQGKIGSVLEKSQTPEALKEQEEILAKPVEINKTVTAVLSFKSKFKVHNKISEVKKSTPSSISLDAISVFGKNEKKDGPSMLVSGVAKDRNSLISFEKTLKEMDFVKSTSIPVSSFAKDFDLPFTITVVLNTQ